MTTELNPLANKAPELLNKYVDAIENYEAEKKEVSEKIKEIYDEAKSQGFDVKTIRQIVKLKQKEKDKLKEEKYLLEVYLDALQLELFQNNDNIFL